MTNGPLHEHQKIEYSIRRLQYAIKQIRQVDYSREGMGGMATQRAIIMRYAFKIIELKKRLHELTGPHSPVYPKWPRTQL